MKYEHLLLVCVAVKVTYESLYISFLHKIINIIFDTEHSVYIRYIVTYRLAPVLKTIFHQCVISYTCSQSNSDDQS